MNTRHCSIAGQYTQSGTSTESTLPVLRKGNLVLNNCAAVLSLEETGGNETAAQETYGVGCPSESRIGGVQRRRLHAQHLHGILGRRSRHNTAVRRRRRGSSYAKGESCSGTSNVSNIVIWGSVPKKQHVGVGLNLQRGCLSIIVVAGTYAFASWVVAASCRKPMAQHTH